MKKRPWPRSRRKIVVPDYSRTDDQDTVHQILTELGDAWSAGLVQSYYESIYFWFM